LPLSSHRQARPAAEAARCAAAEGRYWAYHDRLFAEQPRFAEDRLIAYAVDLGLDRDAFARCLAERRFARDVEADVRQARALGVRGTPTFIINGRVLVGAHPVETFRTIIEEFLRDQHVGAIPGPPLEDTLPFVKVMEVDGVVVGQGTLVESQGVALAVFKGGDGRFFACGAICPHEDGPLAEGWLEGDAVVCPWHGFDFDLQTGRCRVAEALSIPVYPTRVTEGAVEVDLP